MKMQKETKVLDLCADREAAIAEAGAILRAGGLVAIPTETVYGLAANAFSEEAVAKIFTAKGRPQDNPLIVHIVSLEQLTQVTTGVPPSAKALMDAFWPGPLTLILPRGEQIPAFVSAGLDTVAVRFPSDPDTQAILLAAGVPLAAPSANLSGSPSPTRASHVFHDLNGRIDAVVESGRQCAVGVESTVVDLTKEPPVLLRPGAVTPEMLEAVLGKIIISEGVLQALPEGVQAASPGMKYRHYAPRIPVVLLKGSLEAYRAYVEAHQDEHCMALCCKKEAEGLTVPTIFYGSAENPEEQAKELFHALRCVDETNASVVYARCPEPTGIGLALYNRLIRAAGFEVLELGQ